jgi:hypothetical protein
LTLQQPQQILRRALGKWLTPPPMTWNWTTLLLKIGVFTGYRAPTPTKYSLLPPPDALFELLSMIELVHELAFPPMSIEQQRLNNHHLSDAMAASCLFTKYRRPRQYTRRY